MMANNNLKFLCFANEQAGTQIPAFEVCEGGV